MSDLTSIIHGRNGKISKTKVGSWVTAFAAVAGVLTGTISIPEGVAALLGAWQTYGLKDAIDKAAPSDSPAAPPASVQSIQAAGGRAVN